MASIPPHRDHISRNALPAASMPRGAFAPPLPPQPRVPSFPPSPPSPYQHPVPGQPVVYAGSPQNDVIPLVNIAGDNRPNGNWGVIPLLIENVAAQGQPQDLRNNVMDYYDMAYPLSPADFVVPYEYHGHDMNHYARVAQGIPVQAVVPPAPEIDIFDYAGRHAPVGLAPAFVDELPHQAHVPIEPATEVLRRLASRYLDQPDSQVDMVRMEPGLGGGVRVVITLQLADLL